LFVATGGIAGVVFVVVGVGVDSIGVGSIVIVDGGGVGR
jgi:hypothetical protein